LTADPYARLDAVDLLGALDADERLAYEAHLATCRRCRGSLAEISAIPPLLTGLDESVFAAPPEAGPTPGRRVIFTSGTALSETQIKNLQITQSNGPAILALGVPRLFRTADR